MEVLVRTLFNVAPVEAEVLSPVIFALSVADQVKDEPAIFEVSAKLTFAPLQIETVDPLVITGTGFTVTLNGIGFPTQPLNDGVTVYTTGVGEVLVLVSVLAMGEPFCKAVLSPLVLAFSVANQVKVVPTKFADKFWLKAAPLHILMGFRAVATGTGLTVTVTVCAGPVQPLNVGVTV